MSGRRYLVPTHFNRLIDGTAAAPSGAFANDPDTGIYRPATNVLGFVTGGSERVRIDANGAVYIGDTANANVTLGLTINQGANDNEILDLKSSDVAHGFTAVTETDTFGYFNKALALGGGLVVGAVSDADIGTVPTMRLETVAGAAISTAKSTAGRAIVEVLVAQGSGTGKANVVADGNCFGVRARVGGSDTTVALIDEDGDAWLNGALSVAADHTGITGAATMTNQFDETANSTGTGTILFKGATNRNSIGFWKILNGASVRYVPLFDTITG